MNFKPTKTISAAELTAQLQSDPKFVRRDNERQAKQMALELQLREDEKPLLTALAEAGFPVASVWDLVNASASYQAAIPVLI